MSKIRRLLESYSKYISIPWRKDAAPAQRVIFCVYNENEERRLRAKIGEFEYVTREAGPQWVLFDLTDTFAEWLTRQRYAKSYFKDPSNPMPLANYQKYIRQNFESFLNENQVENNTVVAIIGAGSLFGLLKVKEVVGELAPMVKGRLVVFFPGSYENNTYRLLDGYDGWGYLGISITADKVY